MTARRFSRAGVLVPDPSDHPAPPPAADGEDAPRQHADPGRRAGSRAAPASPGGSGRAVEPLADRRRDAGHSAFTEMMLTDLIPMIEKTYRALPGAANRAMAGLSMGGMQTHTTTMANLDKFSYIGLFSGGNIPLAEIKDPAAFKKQVKAVFFGNGQARKRPDASKPLRKN